MLFLHKLYYSLNIYNMKYNYNMISARRIKSRQTEWVSFPLYLDRYLDK